MIRTGSGGSRLGPLLVALGVALAVFAYARSAHYLGVLGLLSSECAALFTISRRAGRREEGLTKRNGGLERANPELQRALKDIKTLKGLVFICSYCKMIRNDEGFWQQLDYVSQNSETQLSHGICPPCLETLYPGRDDPED